MEKSAIDLLELAPMLHSMADTLLYKVRVAESLEELNWVHGRADGFALGLNVAGAVTPWQSDYLMATYITARDRREDQLKAQLIHRPGASSLERIRQENVHAQPSQLIPPADGRPSQHSSPAAGQPLHGKLGDTLDDPQ